MKLPKVYEPGQYEADIYALWEKSHAFTPAKTGKSFSIVVPPPNANGNLHIGHALTLALQDISVRYHRLRGDRALLLPGADHAGFETQVVYEKQLAKEGKSRFDFTREELYQQIWDFVVQNRSNFEEQFRRLGAGVDWSRYTFTLDEKIVKRAYATFKKMWDEGLIYRGERLVNFCTFHGTAFADIEVVYKEEKSHLWHLRYPLTDGSGEIVVATTRPETMLGDTAVAVNPNDKRYLKFVGKTVKLPLTNREIPIITDEFVDEHFGTGAVKITPAHDPNDFDAGKRHDLPMITVIDDEGKMTNVSEAYRGLTVKEAREQVVRDLTDQGFLVKAEDYTHNVGHCYKCNTVIQPLLREQWFIDMKPLATKAIETLRAGKISFYPENKGDQLVTYLEGLRDWNISRQIAWGIPIPAFQNVDEPDDWIYDERVDQEIIEVNGKTYHRDPDVFDTWFSSSSWPYATLDFPDSDDFKTFYPLSLMETGGEILYPWVSRMIMLGLYVTGEIPFESVYIHGYVMAEDGAKMSKSLGNVINPLDVINEYGSDALRMGIIASRVPAVNRGYDHRKVEDARNFCNKLWNIARYIEDKVGDNYQNRDVTPETTADHWLLTNLQHTADKLASDLDNYRFAEAYDTLYHFVWDDFADWYIEASKATPNLPLLAFSLETILKLAHPFAPFVTETIWQTLGWEESLLVSSQWPQVKPGEKRASEAFEQIRAIVSEIRFITKALQVRDVTLGFTNDLFLAGNSDLIKQLSRIKDVVEIPGGGKGIRLTQTSHGSWLDIDPATAQRYAGELAAKRDGVETTIGQLKARLSNASYVQNAPKHIVDQTKQQLADAETLLEKINQEYNRFAEA
jgi:valyl-tRNA synthetase